MSRLSTTALTLALAVFITALSFTLLVAGWFLVNYLFNPSVPFLASPAGM